MTAPPSIDPSTFVNAAQQIFAIFSELFKMPFTNPLGGLAAGAVLVLLGYAGKALKVVGILVIAVSLALMAASWLGRPSAP
ncbi:MAG: hypothetical protein RXO32_10755 [Thermoproteus sp.]